MISTHILSVIIMDGNRLLHSDVAFTLIHVNQLKASKSPQGRIPNKIK